MLSKLLIDGGNFLITGILTYQHPKQISHFQNISIKVRNRTDIPNITVSGQHCIQVLVMQYERKKKLSI